MERWLLVMATLLAAVGGGLGMHSVWKGHRKPWATAGLSLALVCQFGVLWLRGQGHGACPLRGMGEILIFLAWSLTLFYLLVGHTYRVSLLGVFTAPVVVVFQIAALVPGVLDPVAKKFPNAVAVREAHAAFSVLSYGSLALAGVSAVMFLVLDRQLKEHHLASGLFRNLPPVRNLLVCVVRLLWIGVLLLTWGIICGVLTVRHGVQGSLGHLLAAVATWIGYAGLLAVQQVRGLTGRRLAYATVGLFLFSLTVFAFV
jgi:ABC-type uncharacterized transport system permease subunit